MGEIHRASSDRPMVTHQRKFVDRLVRVSFHVENIITARCNPHTALQWNLDSLGFRLPKPQERLHIALLLEMEYPLCFAAPLPETFAFKVQCFGEPGMKHLDSEADQPDGNQRRGKGIGHRDAA